MSADLVLPARKELALVPGFNHRGRPLPVYTVDAWLEDVFQQPVPTIGEPTASVRTSIPRRDRSPITRVGYRLGMDPPNKGKSYEAQHLTREEALRLLDVQPKGKVGVRNRALIALMWRTGLRVAEACAVKPHHVDFQASRVLVLRGKGGKRAWCAIDQFGLMELQPWLMLRSTLSVPKDATLFCSVCLPDPGNRINTAYVREVFRVYGERAHISKRCHPHMLRHTLACEMVSEGFSLLETQAQLRHSSPATTAGYIRSLGADAAFDKVAARRSPLEARDA